MSLNQLICLVEDSIHADELRDIRLKELVEAGLARSLAHLNGPTTHAALELFRKTQGGWISSGYVAQLLDLERWVAQKICVELAALGYLERRGRTSGTRYRLRGRGS